MEHILEIIALCRDSLSLVGVPGKHLSLDSGHHYACRLYFVYYDAGLYADFGINIYYLGAAIYGG